MLRCLATFFLVFVLTGVTGCAPTSSAQSLQIYAASSLAPVLKAVGQGFEAQFPGASLQINYAGSQTLRSQIAHGAPADLFLSAHPEHVKALEAQELLTSSQPFARNALVVIVASNAAAQIQRFGDLVRANRLVLGTPEVPVGRYARSALASQGAEFQTTVLSRVISWEPNARMVLAKLSLGEADATLAYRSDALGAADLHIIELPEPAAQTATYWSGITTNSASTALAKRFQAHLQSAETQQLLRARGFSALP